MLSTQFCYYCNKYYCFCENSIRIHSGQQFIRPTISSDRLIEELKTTSPDLFCYEELQVTPSNGEGPKQLKIASPDLHCYEVLEDTTQKEGCLINIPLLTSETIALVKE